MTTSSKGGRSYSDPSYGSVKTYTFGVVTAGTRATGLVDSWKPMNPITILDWNQVNMTLGTGATSQWVLAATSGSGTAALGTITWTGTHAAGTNMDGTATETKVAKDGVVNLYSVLSTAAGLTLETTITYREYFDVSDN
jgi:hypothetical protein